MCNILSCVWRSKVHISAANMWIFTINIVKDPNSFKQFGSVSWLKFWCQTYLNSQSLEILDFKSTVRDFFKPGFNSMWTENFQMFKLDLEKAEEPEIKLPTSLGSSKKQESSRKTSTCALLTTPKPLTMWMTTNLRKFLKTWGYQTTLPSSWEICMQVKKQQLELNVEQWNDSKLEKKYVKAVYCHPAYLA